MCGFYLLLRLTFILLVLRERLVPMNSGASTLLMKIFVLKMDCTVSIERRFSAMKAFHDAEGRTTCFISPIFTGITDIPPILDRAKEICNLV